MLAEEARRAGTPAPHPSDADTEMLLDDGADDLARLSVVDQLLGSRQGVETLAHLAAARLSTAEPAVVPQQSGTAVPSVPLAFVASPAEARRRRVNSMLKPVLLAASLMMVAGTSWYVFTLPQGADEVRALGSVVELHGVTGATQSAPVTLAWKPLPSVSRYRVESLNANDDPVFTTETNDTTAVVPPGSLSAGTYRWWVRSRAIDGVEIRSRVEKLTIR
jgi:hypothetical protein